MSENGFYTNFSAYVQIAVAFGFGLLYLYKNNRSIFKSVQSVIFDAFRKNAIFKWFLRYPSFVEGKINVRTSPESLCEVKAYLKKLQTKFRAALDMERTCDYLAVLGIVSGIYSVGWLLFVPWSQQHLEHSDDLYLTLTLATVVTDVIMVAYTVCTRISRAKAFIYSVIVLTLCIATALALYQNGITIDYDESFDCLFLISMTVPFASICCFIVHTLFFILYRLYILILALTIALFFHPFASIKWKRGLSSRKDNGDDA
jgi:hypothetical protein